MKSRLIARSVISVVVLVLSLHLAVFAEDQPKPLPTENFYNQSLHFTNRGIAHVYSKEAGGLERLTGISIASLGCMKAECHVQSCDVCHAKEIDGKQSYVCDKATAQAACDRCHPIDKEDPDIHTRKRMVCLDCHSAHDVHGDGTPYKSLSEPGVVETTCEKCHATLSEIAAHTVHQGKLDCIACHTANFVTCFNCHIDSRLKKDKVGAFQVKDMLFLINRGGKVSTGNVLTYVYGNRTMVTVAPSFSHSIKKEGRVCADCHNTKIARDIKADRFKPLRWVKDTMQNIAGVVPIVDGMKWDLVWLTRENDKWTPLKKPETPMFNASATCTPLTKEQLEKLLKPQGVRK